MIRPYLYFSLLQKKRAYVGGKWISWTNFEARAKALANVDFDCRFDSAGACKRQQGTFKGGTVQNCCQGCAINGAYLMSIRPNTACDYADAWHAEWGFWRPGKGCILPRERRSYTCLAYSCNDNAYGKFNPYEFMQTGDKALIQIAMVARP